MSKSLLSLTYVEDRANEALLYQRLLAGTAPSIVLEKRYRRRNGSQIWVRESCSLARAPIDGSVQIIVISEDISARKLAEEERKQHAHALSEKNTQLSHALTLAEKATVMKSRFLATMSHEIRTPLNGVIGMATLALDTKLSDEQREYIETIQSCGQNLMRLINDILDLSRIEAGKLEMESAPLSIRAVAEEVVKLVSPAVAGKDVQVAVKIDPAVPEFVSGDLVRLRQVLTNLASNAIKFTPAGEVFLHAHVLWEVETKLALKFTVRDSGVGIDERTIARLFTPFTQADASVARRHGGSGLGLAISRQLVKMMGGNIGVESEVGQGSTFWFTAVFAKAAQTREKLHATPSGLALARRGRILVAEDNEVNQRIAKRILENAGHSVDVVGNGLRAIENLMETAYDLVLMDMQMPEMDGLTATSQIRRLVGAFHDIPIIAITASAMRGDRETCLAAGMNDYISKPFRSDEMLEVVQRHLVRGPGREAASRSPERILEALSNVTD